MEPARATTAEDRTPAAPASSTRRRLPLGPRYEACGGEAQSRPCPRAECRYYLEDPAPGLFGEDEERPTCALDVAAQGPATAERVGELFGVSKQAIQVTEAKALAKLEKRARDYGLDGAGWKHPEVETYPEEIEDAPRGGGRRRREPVEAQEPLFGSMKK